LAECFLGRLSHLTSPTELLSESDSRYVEAMQCPACQLDDTRVVDSRGADEGASIRRRRVCSSCDYRFTTFERVEEAPLLVGKRSGGREPFCADKIIGGLISASKGRPITVEQFAVLAVSVEDAARLVGAQVTSEWVGLAVLDRLRILDHVAALRFASVYKGFSDVDDFEQELSLIKRDTTDGATLV
jgi:transcriptional repressor NrdR